MAKVSDSIFGDAIGQLGDTITRRVKGKKIISKKGVKKNNHTLPRQRTESCFGDLSKIWGEMKRWEKMTWEELVKTDYSFKNSKGKLITDGMMLFISCNRNLQEADEPMVRIAPRFPVFPLSIQDITFEVIINKKGRDIKMHLPTPINKDIKLILTATPILTSPSISINRRLYRKIKVLDYKCKPDISILKDYIKVFEKMPEEGDEISIQYRSILKKLGTTSMHMHHIVMAKKQTINKKETNRKR